MNKITRNIQDQEMTHSDDPLTVAVRFLSATRTSRGYRYYAPETCKEYRVRVRDMRKLGVALLSEDEYPYSAWCSETVCVELAR